MLLVIDTSTEEAVIALAPEGGPVRELAWRCERNHTVELLPHLAALLQDEGKQISDVTGVIVAVGPGTYNGLRAGVAAAKGLAYSLAVPIAGVGSLEATAYSHADGGLPVCAVRSAGHDEIGAAVYRMMNGVWKELVAPHIAMVETLAAGITEQPLFCGEYINIIGDELKQRLGEQAVLAPGEGVRGRALAELGRKKLAAGNADNVAALQPVYLRRPNITQAKHR